MKTMEKKKEIRKESEVQRDNPPDVIEPPGPPDKRPDVIEPPHEKKKAPLGPAEMK